ncbi:MAG: hypothetical protein KatS3mg031_0096 [Chitinophagales bacterium]|nr:MAG: hypothetical protein KatS3mg031_0096 [Chitinophagales bacterium]
MTEELLQYIWQHRLFHYADLRSTAGERLSVVSPGVLNRDAGPDFTQARIKVNDHVLVGNVEIHLKTSDWKRHRHQTDKAYSNIILHVVYEHDAECGSPSCPTLELKHKIPARLIGRYQKLMSAAAWIPCASLMHTLKWEDVKPGLHRLLVERMEQKSALVAERFAQNKNSWEETLYQIVARNYGLKANADAFELLARSLPLKILAKHKNSLFQIEALLFGQAGLLHRHFEEAYPDKLQEEYRFLRQKYGLTPLNTKLWKFLRMRPISFPTIRIAQFAMLIYRSSGLFSQIISKDSVHELRQLFDAGTSDYWLNHYLFDKPSVKKNKKAGKAFIDSLVINAVLPVLFTYGKIKDNIEMQEKALEMLASLPPDANSILRHWEHLGFTASSAYESQALIQLKNAHCDNKRCLKCFIGYKLLKA